MLWTGRDFVFLDFEGDSTIPISERRIKRSPLRDTARMLRSFHHAAYAGFHQQAERGVISPENLPKFEPWVRHWNRAVSRAYLQAYCQNLHPSGILPSEEDKLQMMLVAYLLNQVIDELGDELQLHSDNVRAPLQAIIHLTDEQMLPAHHRCQRGTSTGPMKSALQFLCGALALFFLTAMIRVFPDRAGRGQSMAAPGAGRHRWRPKNHRPRPHDAICIQRRNGATVRNGHQLSINCPC